MRLLTIIVLLAGALYGGYWFVGARAVDGGAANAVDAMQQQGWLVEVADISTRGFPSRFDTTVTDLTLAPPTRAWRYSAPFVQSLALSYAPNKVIAVLPDQQTLEVAGQELTITADRLRASTGVAANTDLAYQGFTAEGDQIVVASDLGWSALLPRLLAAMRPSASGGAEYDLYAEVTEVTLQDGLAEVASGAPSVIDRIAIDGVLTLTQPLDRKTFQSAEVDPVLPVALAVKDAIVLWGNMQLRATGDLTFPGGIPQGRITFSAANWNDIITLLVRNGVLNPDLEDTYRNMAVILAQGRETLDVPLTFDKGFMSVGPLPLGRAPRIY